MRSAMRKRGRSETQRHNCMCCRWSHDRALLDGLSFALSMLACTCLPLKNFGLGVGSFALICVAAASRQWEARVGEPATNHEPLKSQKWWVLPGILALAHMGCPEKGAIKQLLLLCLTLLLFFAIFYCIGMQYIIRLFVYNALHGFTPDYMSELCIPVSTHHKVILLCRMSDLRDLVSGPLPTLHHTSGTRYQSIWKTTTCHLLSMLFLNVILNCTF